MQPYFFNSTSTPSNIPSGFLNKRQPRVNSAIASPKSSDNTEINRPESRPFSSKKPHASERLSHKLTQNCSDFAFILGWLGMGTSVVSACSQTVFQLKSYEKIILASASLVLIGLALAINPERIFTHENEKEDFANSLEV